MGKLGRMGWKRRMGGLMLLVLLAGCDGFDPSVLIPGDLAVGERIFGTKGQEGDDEVGAAEARARDPEMQSIGPGEAQQVYYQFIDDRGRVQFVERLSDVPKAWRDRVGYVEMSQPPPLTPLEARRTWKLSADQTAEILLATRGSSAKSGLGQNAEVLLYSAPWCGYCTKAKAHLDRSGVDYELLDVDNDVVAQELRDKTGRGGVPVLDFDGEILRGYRAEQYDRAIRSIQGQG